jgi:hypothetical protein
LEYKIIDGYNTNLDKIDFVVLEEDEKFTLKKNKSISIEINYIKKNKLLELINFQVI